MQLGFGNCTSPCGGSPLTESITGWTISCSGYVDKTCKNGDNRSVVYVFFSNQYIAATIPSELVLLSNLLAFQIRNSHLMSGTLPTELVRLSSLTELVLNGIPISGTLPTQLNQLYSLRIFALGTDLNALSGTLPALNSLGQVHCIFCHNLTFLFDYCFIPALKYSDSSNCSTEWNSEF